MQQYLLCINNILITLETIKGLSWKMLEEKLYVHFQENNQIYAFQGD